MSSVSTVTLGLNAALRLARGRADGVVLVPGDRETIVRSFWAIALCLPSVIVPAADVLGGYRNPG